MRVPTTPASRGRGGQSESTRRAYALLLTLILLAVVATGIAVVAGRSFRASLHATGQQRQIQQKWLASSARGLLAGVDRALAERAVALTGESGIIPIASEVPGLIRQTFDLGHHRLEVTLADEQAKANLNDLYRRYDRSGLVTKLQDLTLSTGGSGALPDPRPVDRFASDAAESDVAWPPFVWFDQLYAREDRSDETAVLHEGLMDHATLWGDGRIRADRAGRAALHAVLTPLLSEGQVGRLVRGDLEAVSGTQATGRPGGLLNLSDRQRAGLAERLTEASQTFSVRLTLDNGRRGRGVLLIGAGGTGPGSQTNTLRFNW